jgi:O-antigen ligase
MDPGRIGRFSRKVIESGVIFLVIFTPLAFGTVHIWAYSIMELGVILLMLAWVIKSAVNRHSSVKAIKMPLQNMLVIIFVGLLLFQLLPLPPAVLRYLSPSTYDLYRDAGISAGGQGGEDGAEDRFRPASSWRTLSIYPYAAKTELFKILAYIGLFYLVSHNLTGRRQINRLLAIIISVGCFEAFYGLLEYLSGHQYILCYRKKYYTDCVTGTFVNRNHFAGYLELVIPLTLGMMVYYWRKSPPSPLRGGRGLIARLASEPGSKLVLLASAAVIMLLGVIFSQSRMGMLSVAASLLVMGFLLMWVKEGKRFLGFISFVLVSASLGGLWLGIEPLASRFSFLPKEIAVEGNRAAVWGDTIQLVKDFPLWGSGLGSYRYIFPKYKRIRTQTSYHHAHNDYLELAAETGIIGLLIILGLAGCFLARLVIGWRRRRRDPYVKGIVLGGIGGLTALLFHSITDFNMHIPANPLLLSVIMGVSWGMLARSADG